MAESNKSHLKIMIMNAKGKNSKDVDAIDKSADKRKQAIRDVVVHTRATLVLFQEFISRNIDRRAWKGSYSWPAHLQYTGNTEASIMFDRNKVTVEELPSDTRENLIKKGGILKEFTLNQRMCLKIVNTKEDPIVKFICISWHGRYKATLIDRKNEFERLFRYIVELSEELSLPVLLAGDFNVKIQHIETLVPPSLVLYKYKPIERRKPEDIIDFFITCKSLVMSDINALSLTSATTVEEVLKLFDHDPVVSFMTTKTEDKDSLTSEIERLSLSSKTSETDTTSDISAKVED